ncbi:MAG: hypothetical protein AMK72_12835 [Planctomycetes bacterium SM23_25]|nr:MAG: hypothetical protein AMK72_12835 [Planctomycetes bacterium SM23_25]
MTAAAASDTMFRMKGSDLHPGYVGLARILRVLLISYGLGTPVILLSNGSIFAELREQGNIGAMAVLFGIGVGMQLVAAVPYKIAVRWFHRGELEKKFQRTRRYKLAKRPWALYPLEAVFDLASIGLYVWGTVLAA